MIPAILQLFAQQEPPPEAAAAMGIFMLICIGVSMIVGLISMVFWVWMLIDCIQNEPKAPDNQFVLWLIVILLAGALGALIYYFVRRGPRMKNPQAVAPYGQMPGKF